jgi:hypothetical protein
MLDSVPPDDEHVRPTGCDDRTVAAVGKVSEALETIERARGALYDFHQLMGHADFQFGEAAELLDAAGHHVHADELRRAVVGRNTLPGRWTFQIVEEFDDGYYAAVKSTEKHVRAELVGGRRHVYESEMKEARRSAGRPGHEARPEDTPTSP